ncbi:MAG: DUF86 domain-containing protein [Euryarchaeota archaeon]|nr:DUF86 domain-containing protein [Euryarchaeota archaeon]
MKRDYKLFLIDIISAMDSIELFIEDMTFRELKEDDKTSSAVIRKFEIIGEATKHLPEVLIEKHPEIPWKSMSGMRDRLIHAYFGVDYKLVWDAIKIEIPKLKPKLQKILG